MPSFWSELLGSKPEVPKLPTLSLADEQKKAVAANLDILPEAQQIAGKVNLFNQEQIDKMLENVIPNYKAITGQIDKNLGALVSGQIPSDVSAAVQQSSAARALGGGYAGTGAGRNLVARDLGLTSLDLTQKGLASAESWLKTAASLYSPGQFNVTSMFVTPMQQYGADNEQNVQQFQNQWMKNQIAAQPAMWAQDLKEAVEATLSAYGGASYQHAGTLPVQGGVNSGHNFGGGNNYGFDNNTGSSGMYGSPSGPEGDFGGGGFGGGDFGSAGAGGVTGDFGSGFGGGAGGLA